MRSQANSDCHLALRSKDSEDWGPGAKVVEAEARGACRCQMPARPAVLQRDAVQRGWLLRNGKAIICAAVWIPQGVLQREDGLRKHALLRGQLSGKKRPD